MAGEQKYNEKVFHVHPPSILPGVVVGVFSTSAGVMCNLFFSCGELGQNFALLWEGTTTTTRVFNSNLLHVIPRLQPITK
jgi:hypothetical protein